MSELRQDPTTKEWVIIAPERTKRPQQEPNKKHAAELPNWDASCPFCPGNESLTPPEVFRLPIAGQDSDWEVRVVPNRFAALTLEGDNTRREESHLYRKMDGFGIHEVIIESSSHNTPMALMTYQQVEKVLITYRERYKALKGNDQLRLITIFKNHGLASGTSLAHPHTQVVATPVITPYYHRRFDIAHDYYADTDKCLYCDLIIKELEQGKRIIAETQEFVVFHPYASRTPYETWIISRTHHASFGLLSAEHLTELATVLKDSLLCLYRELDNPAFNLMVDTTTTEYEEDPCYHWHIRIVPRQSTIAGFEIGSGIYISDARPEDTAKLMRECCLSCHLEDIVSLKPKV